jgi:hypothetical protein
MEYQGFQALKDLFLIPGLTPFSIGLDYQKTIAADASGKPASESVDFGIIQCFKAVYFNMNGNLRVPFINVLSSGTAGAAECDFCFTADFFIQTIGIHYTHSCCWTSMNKLNESVNILL